MRNILKHRRVIQVTHWSLVVAALVFLISGFGITEFRIVETLTFGLLTKTLAFKIHEVLWIPFVILLVLHSYQGLSRKKKELH
jgi:cytochrome b subunit of formate dehydrogenase